MNRALFAMVFGLGMGLMGCATAVEDPLEPVPAAEEQRDPPNESLSVGLRTPQQQLLDGIEINDKLSEVPAKQVVPTPIPTPE